MNLCACGCGKIVLRTWANGHKHRREAYAIEDRGYDTPCWVWLLSTNDRGYAIMGRLGVELRVHRVYFERLYGPVPRTFELDHLCKVKACVNPAHLEAVTHAENVRRGPGVKLCVADVDEIRRRHAAERGGRRRAPNGLIAALAQEFGVSKGTIHDALSRSWQ